MTDEKLNEILEIKRLLDNANWFLNSLKVTAPVKSFSFYGEGETTACYDKATVNDIIETIEYGKETLERVFREL